MVAPPASSDAPRFTPIDRPRIAIAGDGTVAAIAEATRVVVLTVPGAEPFAEVGVDPEAVSNDVAWITGGAPPRLIVLSRYVAHSVVHLIDPHGPRTVAEIRLETPMKLYATVGAHALAIGAQGAVILTATDTHLTPFQFPARTMPVTAGAAGANFIVALPGSIEEWDPASRMPKRRLKLPRPAAITALGGSERVVWMTTQQEPARLDVIALVNRGQPKGHDLPEPIGAAAGHPRSDLVVCIGADSGKFYVIDLDGRTRMRTLTVPEIERADAAGLVVGRVTGALIAQAHRPVAIITLDGKELDSEPPTASSAVAPAPVRPAVSSLSEEESLDPDSLDLGDDDEAPTPAGAASSSIPTALDAPPASTPVPRIADAESSGADATKPMKPGVEPKKATNQVAQDLAGRFSAWRDRMRASQPRSTSASAPWVDTRPSWRDEAVAWTRAVVAGTVERGAPACAPIDALAVRFDLPAPMIPSLVLLYGAHLGGERGVAPADIARVLGRRWDEALGRGQLAQLGLAEFVDSRVRLARPIQRMLDELPPATGSLVGTPGANSLLGPCVVVARDDAPLSLIAERTLPTVGGAILVANADVEPGDLFVEARARGAAAMLRVAADDVVELGTDPAILVVSDAAIAEQLGIPRLG